MGAPNVVRGGSHKKNISALELVQEGLCFALASDYHYPSPRLAALALAKEIGLLAAWQLVSSGPAAILGLKDRCHLQAGYRADLVILEAQSQQVAAAHSCIYYARFQRWVFNSSAALDGGNVDQGFEISNANCDGAGCALIGFWFENLIAG